MLDKLGSEVAPKKAGQVVRFLKMLWPALANKKIDFMAFEKDGVVSTVSTGVAAPCSKCCKARLNF